MKGSQLSTRALSKDDRVLKGKGERPKQATRYRVEYAGLIALAVQMGATQPEICSQLGITRQQLWRWERKYRSLADALKVAREDETVRDRRAVDTLYSMAMGYSLMDTDFRVVDGQVYITEYIKHIPPNVTALIFWLKNRIPDKWRDQILHSIEQVDTAEQESARNTVMDRMAKLRGIYGRSEDRLAADRN